MQPIRKPELTAEEQAELKRQEDLEREELDRQIREMYGLDAKAPQERVDPIAIIRKARDKHRDWSGDASHFGGLPRLGKAEWPRGKDGKPLPFIAQLDLAEVAMANPETPLPRTGSLAFFISEGAVIYVPEGVTEQADPPWDLPPAFVETSYPLPEHSSDVTRPLFPFWPVDLHRLRMPDDLPGIEDDTDIMNEIHEVQDAAFKAIHRGCEEDDRLNGDVQSYHWYTAQLVLRQPKLASEKLPEVIARAENYKPQSLPEIEQEARDLRQFIQQYGVFVADRNPWDALSAEETAVFVEAHGQLSRDFENICQFEVTRHLRDLQEATHRRMITGDMDAVVAMPDGVLERDNRCERRPSPFHHQMFGLGAGPQMDVFSHIGDYMLLQIGWDIPPEFTFGDVGG